MKWKIFSQKGFAHGGIQNECNGVWKSTSPIIDLFLIEGLEAQYDMIVVGGGAIGCSVAFWLMQRVIEGFKILVVERDPQVLTYFCHMYST